jgi:hypothetical protein
MITLREAAQQALKAMDKATRYMSDSDYRNLNEAITALRAALEQPEQTNLWRDAVDHELSTLHMVASDDPRESIRRLIDWHCAVQIDPLVSSAAQELIERGKREALEQPERHVSYVCPQCHWSLEQPEQPYAEQARRVEQETHGRMRIDPVTGDVSIGTPTEHLEPPPEAQTEAEKIAYCAGWWAAMEKMREPTPMRAPKENDRVICIEDESLGSVWWTDAAGGPYIKFDDGSYGQWMLHEFGKLFRYAALEKPKFTLSCGCPSQYGGVPAYWERDGSTAFGMICEKHWHEYGARSEA